MKLLAIIATLITLVVIGVWQLRTPEPSESPQPGKGAESSNAESARNSDIAESQGPGSEAVRGRLFDPGYENDPELIAAAKAAGLPPACVIAVAKFWRYQIPLEPSACPSPYEAALRDAKGPVYPRPGQSHPYDQYSNSKLETMAMFDPAAAMILARRVEDDQRSLHYYERALVLTGNPQPLVEWLNYRIGGVSIAADGTIDVKEAKLSYKIYLVASEFGLGEGVAEHYEQQLLAAGADITATKAKAERITNQIKAERRGLFPNANNKEET